MFSYQTSASRYTTRLGDSLSLDLSIWHPSLCQRQAYDMYGEEGVKEGMGASHRGSDGGAMDDLLSQLFGGRRGHPMDDIFGQSANPNHCVALVSCSDSVEGVEQAAVSLAPSAEEKMWCSC